MKAMWRLKRLPLPIDDDDAIRENTRAIRNETSGGLADSFRQARQQALRQSIERAENLDDLKRCLLFVIDHNL